MIERADRLKSPPVKGRFYLVPAILWDWGLLGREPKWWPVLGNKHKDVEFFDFHYLHYHVDPRFMTTAHWRDAGDPWDPTISALDLILSRPLSSINLPHGPAKPVPRRMRCSMVDILYGHDEQKAVVDLNKHHAGQQCHKGKRGWVCPHRHIALGSIAPIDGVITCPLHGLRVDAATGKCLGPIA